MLSMFATPRFRCFIWIVLVSFIYSSIPNIELALSCAGRLISHAVFTPAYAQEEEVKIQKEVKTPEEVKAQGEVKAPEEAKAPDKQPPEPEDEKAVKNASDAKDKKKASTGTAVSLMSAEAGGAGDSAGAGASTEPPKQDMFSGAATYKIPINTPPGRANMSPNIALTYNSHQGNGLAGVGWSLDLGSIQRSTKKGLDYTRNDYVASMNGATGELIAKTNWGTNYYGNKIDSSLFKYYYNTSTKGWEVTGKDGTKYYYGSASASRQLKGQDENKIFKWCLDKVVDANGNYMTVSYIKDQGEIYPSFISYTGNNSTSPALSPTNSVQFYYEDGRTDKPMMSPAQSLAIMAKRLKTIEVRGKNNTLVHAYSLAYNQSASTYRSLLSQVQKYGSDAVISSGVITAGTALPPITVYSDTTAQSFAQNSFYTNGMYGWNPGNSDLGDFNGDGKMDISISLYGNSRMIKFSNGDGTFTDGPVFYLPDADTWYTSSLGYGDFNGDGKMDIIYLTTTENTRKILFSNGDGTFTEGPAFTVSDISDMYNVNFLFMWSYGDFNGDGKTDIIYLTNFEEMWKIKFSNGDGTFTDGPFFGITGVNYYNTTSLSYGDFNGDGKMDICSGVASKAIMFSNGDGTFTYGPNFPVSDISAFASNGDFNGDGKMDIIFRSGGTWKIKFGNGDGTFTDGTTFTVSDMSPQYFYSYRDFNGDGKIDICYYTTAGTWKIKLSNGDGTFTDGTTFTMSGLYYLDPSSWAFGDFNGDGKTDITYTVNFYHNEMLLSVAGLDTALTISNSMGGATAITYKSSSAYSNTLLPFSLKLVDSLAVSDGRGTTTTSTYFYSGGLFDIAEREFRGFKNVTSYLMYNTTQYENKTETEFNQDAVLKGTMKKQTTTSKDGHIRRVDNTYAVIPITGGGSFPSLKETLSTMTDAGYNPYTVKTTFLYDSYLCATEEHTYGSPDLEKITSYSYYTDTTNWIFKPSIITTKDKNGNITGRKWMAYSTTGNLLTEEVCKSDTPASGCASQDATRDPVVTYTYYTEGNVQTVTDPRGYATAFTYDDTKTFRYEVTNYLGHKTTNQYDNAGRPTTLIPPHLQGTSYAVTHTYDVFGRMFREDRPDGGYTTYAYSLGNPNTQYVQKTTHIDSLTHDAYSYFDGLGRGYSTSMQP